MDAKLFLSYFSSSWKRILFFTEHELTQKILAEGLREYIVGEELKCAFIACGLY